MFEIVCYICALVCVYACACLYEYANLRMHVRVCMCDYVVLVVCVVHMRLYVCMHELACICM